MTEPDLEFITGYLATRDVPCVSCGYNLRGLKFGAGAAEHVACRCPECGKALSRHDIVNSANIVGLRVPRQFIRAGFATAFLVAGMMVLDALRIWQGGSRYAPAPSQGRCVAAMIVSLACIPTAYWWVRIRQRLRWPTGEAGERTMWLWGAAIWLAPIAALAVYYTPE